MPLDRSWIEQHIPHKGRMCLLDEVLHWDARQIRCRSASHRTGDNPLRAHGRLGVVCGIEYAAQAMAVHGALVGASAPLASAMSGEVPDSFGGTLGYLASVRNVTLHVTRLDDLRGDLIACAQRLAGDARTVLYEFSVTSEQLRVLDGRASIVIDPHFAHAGGGASVSTAKYALVTGGSGGIGAALCRRLARDGHHVYVHAHRNAATAEALVEEIRAAGGAASPVGFDITDAEGTRAAIEGLLETAPIQILVNNAGLHDDAVLPGMSSTQWHRVIDVSVNGFFNATQPLLLPMIRTRWGRIVNVSSIAALIGNRGQVNYAAAKGALISASKALALEVATRGVTVNSIAPGIIGTPMSAGLFDAAAIERLVPMNRPGLPEEVAGVVSFLTSEDASYVTAQVISVSGGMA